MRMRCSSYDSKHYFSFHTTVNTTLTFTLAGGNRCFCAVEPVLSCILFIRLLRNIDSCGCCYCAAMFDHTRPHYCYLSHLLSSSGRDVELSTPNSYFTWRSTDPRCVCGSRMPTATTAASNSVCVCVQPLHQTTLFQPMGDKTTRESDQ